MVCPLCNTFVPNLIASVAQFMHNGGISNFKHIKRRLQSTLPDVAFNAVHGNTGVHFANEYSVLFTASERLGMGLCFVFVQGAIIRLVVYMV
jgi:predicted glutamine amidotransferase